MSEEELHEGEEARIRGNLERLRIRMAESAERSGRDPAGVRLLAVAKYAEPRWVRILHGAGVRDFAESTVQRGAAAVGEHSGLERARWHLIGHLQRNKVARALSIFSSIHSMDSLRLAAEVAAQARRRDLPLPGLYVEVNAASDLGKTGLPADELRGLLEAVRNERLFAGLPCGGGDSPALAGLMTMAPPPGPDEPPGAAESARPSFRKLRELRDDMVREDLLPASAGLSMGMSSDFQIAIEEGSTVVRVGSWLFEGLRERLQ